MNPQTTTTKAAGHTPGPWKVSSSVIVIAPNDQRDCPTICNTMDLGGLSGFPIDEAEANARLIASAPELLKACRKDVERIRQLCGMVNSYAGQLGIGKKVNAEDWDDEARAAIARATGGQV